MNKSKLTNIIAPIVIIAGFLAPLAYWEIREGILFIYKSIINGQLISMIDANGILNSKVNILSESVWVAGIALYCLVIRAIAGIDTPLRKTFFAFGNVFYFIPFQVTLIIIVVSIFQNFSAIEWNIQRIWATSIYTSTLAMSLWIYRVLVSRKNPLFKTTLAVFANALIVLAAIIPFLLVANWSYMLAIALIIAWIATAADITFNGFGYKIIAKIFGK